MINMNPLDFTWQMIFPINLLIKIVKKLSVLDPIKTNCKLMLTNLLRLLWRIVELVIWTLTKRKILMHLLMLLIILYTALNVSQVIRRSLIVTIILLNVNRLPIVIPLVMNNGLIFVESVKLDIIGLSLLELEGRIKLSLMFVFLKLLIIVWYLMEINVFIAIKDTI